MTATQVPDFANWKVGKTLSIFTDRARQDIYIDEYQSGDEKKQNWVGVTTPYNSPDGYGDGKEMNFFGKGIVVKSWGLKGEDYSFFSIADRGIRRIYAGREYAFTIATFANKNNQEKIIGCFLRVYRKDSNGKRVGEKVLEVEILAD